MAVYYPLFAEPFDITQEPPLHTAIITSLVESYQKTLQTPTHLAKASTPPDLLQASPLEYRCAQPQDNDWNNLPAILDKVLLQFLRTDRNIKQSKKTKVGIVYFDLLFRIKSHDPDRLQEYLRDLLIGQFSSKSKCASAFRTDKSNMSRCIPYSRLINWLGDIGYRVGHIESLYVDPRTRDLPGQPLVNDHIKDLTTRELQLITIGSTLGSLAASTPATSLDGSVKKLREMAFTCANLLSEVIPIPEKPLNYHNNFFHIVNDIVKASCRVTLPNQTTPDCRVLLKTENPIPKIADDDTSKDKISRIIGEWPLIISQQLIEHHYGQLLKTKLEQMGRDSGVAAHSANVNNSLISNQHSMISRALAELQYLAVFLRISDNATGDTLIKNAISDMLKQIAKMEDLASTNSDLFIIEDLGFHEVIPRLVANYSQGQFNPMNLERFVLILHESAFNRTRSRLSTPEERMAIVEDHKAILEALKLYHSDSSKSAEHKAAVVDCLSRHLYLALNSETASEDEISSIARDSVSDAIKLFGLTAGSFTHQATSLWTEQGAKRMLFVSDYQLPREMLGGDEADPTKQDLNIIRFIIALYKLHKIVSNDTSATNQPFIFIFYRQKEELETLFPTPSYVRNAAIKYYSMHRRIMQAEYFELEKAFANAKTFYQKLISSADLTSLDLAAAELSETDKDLLRELKDNSGNLDAVLNRILLIGERSLIGPYHKPGGAVAWIQGRDDKIFRTKRVSESGAITQDIWGGDEDLRFLIDICTSIQKSNKSQSNPSAKLSFSNKKGSAHSTPIAGQDKSQQWSGLAASILISFSLLNGLPTDLTQYVATCRHNIV